MTSRNGKVLPFPSSARRATAALGLYIRAGRNDKRDLLELVAAGDADCFGIVFDPTLAKPQRELRELARDRLIDVVLDPRTQPLAMPGGFTESLGHLPWGGDHIHELRDFTGHRGLQLIGSIADFAIANKFTQILAPTHVLRHAQDNWLQTDIESTERLRRDLDERGARNIPIIYSLAITYAMLRDPDQRYFLVRELEGLPIDAVWLRVDGFGMGSTGAAVRSYLEGVVDFHSLEIPIVADGVGGLAGLALAAFGGVGGIAHGVTVGENFDTSHWRKARNNKPFGLAKRIYVPPLDLYLKRNEADMLFSQGHRARSLFACPDTNCCPRGVTDMLNHPARHFFIQRKSQLQMISSIPESVRASRFVEQTLRPTTDKALIATRLAWSNDRIDLTSRITKQRKRLDMMRITLGNLADQTENRSRAVLPKTLRSRNPHAIP